MRYFLRTIRIISFRAILGFLFFISGLAGLGFYLFSRRRREVLRNLRLCLAREFSPFFLRRILRASILEFGRIISEIFLVPWVDKDYIKSCISLDEAAFLPLKQAVIVGVHMGNWEYANARLAQIRRYRIFVHEQPSKRGDAWINLQRQRLGLEVVKDKGFSLRKILEALEQDQWVGFVVDHGTDRRDPQIEFFGRKCPYPQGGTKISHRYSIPTVLCSIRREGIFSHRIELETIFNPQDFKDHIHILRALNSKIEEIILKYPQHYNWFFKRYKYSSQRWILFLSDGKPGHLKQLKYLEEVFKKSKFQIVSRFVKIEFRSRVRAFFYKIGTAVFARTFPQVLLYLSHYALKEEVFKEIFYFGSDMVISCSSSASFVNLAVSHEDQSKSVHILRPSFLPFSWFSKVFLPFHDRIKSKNIINFEGALGLADKSRLPQAAKALKEHFNLADSSSRRISLFLGGRSRHFDFKPQVLKDFLSRLKNFAQDNNVELFITTSRRTPAWIERFLEERFKDFQNCKVLIIANKENYPFVVEGFLEISHAVVVSCDSISMVWEAVSSGKEVFILELPPKKRNSRHIRFLEDIKKRGWARSLPDNLDSLFISSKKDLDSYSNSIQQKILSILE